MRSQSSVNHGDNSFHHAEHTGRDVKQNSRAAEMTAVTTRIQSVYGMNRERYRWPHEKKLRARYPLEGALRR